jgi:predicted transcriptional regulator
MNKTKMLSFRLDAALLRKVEILRISRHRTRGEIIREALEMYFRVYNPVSPASNRGCNDSTV